jgi:hypothetical protein
MAIWARVPDIYRVLDLMGIRIIFYLWVAPESRLTFFSPVGNPITTRYFTTIIILDCEQLKMCLVCYINSDLF